MYLSHRHGQAGAGQRGDSISEELLAQDGLARGQAWRCTRVCASAALAGAGAGPGASASASTTAADGLGDTPASPAQLVPAPMLFVQARVLRLAHSLTARRHRGARAHV